MTEDAQDPYAGVKRLRKFLIVLLVLISLSTIAYSLVTLNFLRQPMEEKFGGMLKINGDIKLGMDGFHPTLVAHDVTYNKITLKKAEARIPFAQPKPGKPIETHIMLTALALPDRPPIDIDLTMPKDMNFPQLLDTLTEAMNVNMVSVDFTARAGEELLAGFALYNNDGLDVFTRVIKLDYGLLYPGASGGGVTGNLILKAKGDQTTILRNLNGTLKLKGGKGKVPGRALGLWSGSVLAALLPNDAVVNCAVAEFDVKNGVATATRIGVDTENLNITGTGTIDFNNLYMSMVFTPQPKTAGTVNTAVPLEVSGVFGEVTATPVGSPVAPNAAAPSPCQVSP
ncbi:MAG: hypothetical protein ACAH80_18110 [Alphaproteobacteria bacterium]